MLVSITSSRNGEIELILPELTGPIYDVCESLVVIPLNWH